MNMNLQGRMKGSFFDKISHSLSYEPTIEVLSEEIKIRQPPLLSGEFLCKDLNSKSIMRGIFSLHKDSLNYHGRELDSKPIKILNLSYSRLFFQEAPEKYTIRITKGQLSFELVYFDKMVFEAWLAEFQKFCIFTDFDSKYEFIEILEKTKSSSHICLLESKMGGKHYTAKVFDKLQWSSSQNVFQKTSLINEIETMRKINYHRIPKLYEVYETESSIYLIMEFTKDQSLENLFKMPKWQQQTGTKSIMFSILKTLAYIASQGIIHRNIKPANIIIEKGSKNIKVVNFSLATFLDSPKVNFRTCGTPGYIAPEIFVHDGTNESAKIYDSRCDVFSAGCIFFQMLFGYPLFEGSDSSEIFALNEKGVSKEIKKTISVEINNPKSCKDKRALNLLLKLLENDPKQRITAVEALSHPYFEAYQASLKPEDHQLLQDVIEKSHLENLLSLSPRRTRKGSDVSLLSENSPNRITLSEKPEISTDYLQPETSSGYSPISKPCTSLLIYNKCLNEGSQSSKFSKGDSSILKVTTILYPAKNPLKKENSVPSCLGRRNHALPSETHFARKNCIEIEIHDDEGWDDIFDEKPDIKTNYNFPHKKPSKKMSA